MGWAVCAFELMLIHGDCLDRLEVVCHCLLPRAEKEWSMVTKLPLSSKVD